MNARLPRALLLALLACAPEEKLTPLRVCALYPVSGSSEDSLAMQVRQGVLEARVGGDDFMFEEHTPESTDEAGALLDDALAPRQGRRLVIAMGEVYAQLLDARECSLNGAQVLQLAAKPRPCEHLRSLAIETFTPGFLAGVLAVSSESVAPRRVAGVISASPSSEIAALIDGFVAGAAYAGGSTQMLELESFEPTRQEDQDATLAEVLALAEAVDVLLVAGAGENDLILEAVRQHNTTRAARLLRVIGLDLDVSVLDAELSLGAIFRQYHSEVRSSILAAALDAFSPGQVSRGFHDRQSGLLINPEHAGLASRSSACDDCETLADAVHAALPAAEAAAAQRALFLGPVKSSRVGPRARSGHGRSAP